MSEPTDARAPEPPGTDQADLRPALEAMRREAAQEIARLKRKLAERESAVESGIESATDRIALHQELTTLKHSLGEKEKNLDKITDECRRLEDQLEDQNQAFDGLRQEVQRKDLSLKAAREEVQRLQRALAGLRDQTVEPAVASNGLPLPPVQADAPPRPFGRAFTVATALALGVVAIGVGVLLLRGFGPQSPGQDPTLAQRPDIPIAATREVAEAPADSAPVPPARPAKPAVPAMAVAAAPTEPPPTLRDDLSSGGKGPTLVRVPGGVYRMGSNSLSGSDSGPEHEVRVPPFFIGAYEVTFQQYDAFARATGRPFPSDYGWGRGNRPAIGVSWSDAVAYTNWLSRQTGGHYRLPSESEWELAARSGSRSHFWWGVKPESGRALCFDCGTRWDNRTTAPVGSFPASPYGLYDTAGNVLEWVSDCYARSYEGAPIDGRPRLDGDCSARIARGGAFNRPAASMRVWVRSKLVPDTRLNSIGFRIARDL